MQLTVKQLLESPKIIDAIIDRIRQQRLDTIYWQQYGSFSLTTTRLFKTYIGTVTGVKAGSIISKNDKKPIRERRTLGSGVCEVANLGDRYQMDIDRLSDLQDLIDRYNAANAEVQPAIITDIIDFIVDDFRQVVLAPHKRMDLVVGEMLMKGTANVYMGDNSSNEKVLDITLPFHTITPTSGDVTNNNFITYLQNQINSLKASYGVFPKMIMSRGTFVKNIIGAAEFSDKYKMILGSAQFDLKGGLVTSEMASEIFRGIGLPAIEIKEDYIETEAGNVAMYADNRITLLPGDNVLRMRHHRPFRATDPLVGRTYTQADGQCLISSYSDEEGRYMEYECEWIPEFISPNKIVNFNLETLNA